MASPFGQLDETDRTPAVEGGGVTEKTAEQKEAGATVKPPNMKMVFDEADEEARCAELRTEGYREFGHGQHGYEQAVKELGGEVESCTVHLMPREPDGVCKRWHAFYRLKNPNQKVEGGA